MGSVWILMDCASLLMVLCMDVAGFEWFSAWMCKDVKGVCMDYV